MYRTDAASGTGLGEDGSLAGLPAVSVSHSLFQLAIKRTIDVVGAVVTLVVFLPLLCIVAGGVALSSGLPLIYSHRRVGLRGQSFNVYKFRSMRKNADQVLTAFLDSDPGARTEWEAFRKLKDDP